MVSEMKKILESVGGRTGKGFGEWLHCETHRRDEFRITLMHTQTETVL